VTVTISCVADPNVANDDGPVLVPDSGATPIDVLANDSHPDGPILITTASNGSQGGIVTVTGGGTGVTYDPMGICGSSVNDLEDVFTYEITGGDTAQVSVTIDCV
jgi:hypothetical protein